MQKKAHLQKRDRRNVVLDADIRYPAGYPGKDQHPQEIRHSRDDGLEAAGAAAPAEAEKTEFDVVLTGFDAAAKIKVIKVVREITSLGLAEAKAAVEGTPKTLKEALSKEDAEAMKKKLTEAGATVEIK